MSAVTPEEAAEWIQVDEEEIQWMREEIDAGKADQATWQSLGLSLLGLGRALFLHGDPLDKVRDTFREAGQALERPFLMAYDKSSPLYLGRKSDPTTVTDGSAIDGLNAALMAGDFQLARQVAKWVPAEPADPSTPAEVKLYTRGLQKLLLGQPAQARDLVGQVLRKHGDKPPKKGGYARNFYTLCAALAGLLDKDEVKFNEALRQQAEFYNALAHGENQDTAEEHLCDHLVALGNLGAEYELEVTGEVPFLPRELLLPVGEPQR